MKQLLVIAQAVAPVGGSHSTRVTNFISHLNRTFQVDVLTTKVYPNYPEMDFDLFEKIKTISFIRSFPGPLHRYKYRKKGLTGKANYSGKKTIKLKKFLIPDSYIEWLPWAVSAAIFYFFGKRKPDAIFTSAVPYTCHLVGYLLSKFWKKPLILDYGDPWVYDPGRPKVGLRLIIENYLEKKVVKHAKAIVVTTSTTKDLYVDKFSLDENKVFVVPMGFDPNDIPFDHNFKKIKKGKIEIVYTGRIEPESRDAQSLFQAISAVKNNVHRMEIVFEFLGSFGEDIFRHIKNYKIDKNFKILGWHTHSECMKKIYFADAVILLGNYTNLQVPGKLYNYIGCGTPVIYLSNIANEDKDPVEEELKSSGILYWKINNTKENIEEFFEKIFIKHKISLLPKIPYDSEKYSWESRSRAIEEILNKVA